MRTISIQLEPGETEVTVIIRAAAVPAPVIRQPRPEPKPRFQRPDIPEATKRAAADISEIVRLVAMPLGKKSWELKREVKLLVKKVGAPTERSKADPVIQRNVLAFSTVRPGPAVMEAVEANLVKIASLAKSVGSAGVMIAALDLIGEK